MNHRINDSKNDVIIEHEPYEDKIVQKLKNPKLKTRKRCQRTAGWLLEFEISELPIYNTDEQY